MVTLIVNPVAGERRGLKLLDPLQHLLSRLGGEVEVVKTIAPGDGAHLAAVALKRGCDHVVAVGGDGTVHEVLASIYGQRVTLGIVPIGSTNTIAHDLALPSDWEEAVRVALTGAPRSVDVGLVNERPFLSAATLATETPDGTPTGFGAFGRIVGRAEGPKSVLAFDLELDGRCTLSAPARSLRLGNLPRADDGLLDLSLAGEGSPTHVRVRSIDVRSPSELAVILDGEIRRASTPLVVRTAPERQEILCPGV